jgi:uroporphyrin-3 C-methyltransferase
MSDPQPVPPPPPSRRLPGALWFLLALALLVAGLLVWRAMDQHRARADDGPDLSNEGLDARLLQAEAAITSLRRGLATANQQLTDTRARTGLLRDEVLGVSQRSSLLEDSVRELAGQQRNGIASLRLDEVELLLALAQQRLQLSGDLRGAIRATELADSVLAMQRDPQLLDLRQTLAQELAAMRALPPNPTARAAGELDALEAVLPRLASASGRATSAARTGELHGWRKLLASFVQVRRSGSQDLLSPADRDAGMAALSLELALARTALARQDQAAFRASIARVDGWLQRLYPPSPLLAERRQRLATLRTLSLGIDLPVAGTSLEELRRILRERQSLPAPLASAAVVSPSAPSAPSAPATRSPRAAPPPASARR